MAAELSKVRRSIQPRGTDSWQSIAEREFPGESLDSAVQQLQSWNLHVFMRPAAPTESPRAGNPILPSDVIFVEPPLTAGQSG